MSFSTRVLALVVLTLAAPACKKAGSNAPGGAGGKGLTVEESDKKRTAAQQDAKARQLEQWKAIVDLTEAVTPA